MPDVAMMCNGLLAGLGALTGPCAFVTSLSAMIPPRSVRPAADPRSPSRRGSSQRRPGGRARPKPRVGRDARSDVPGPSRGRVSRREGGRLAYALSVATRCSLECPTRRVDHRAMRDAITMVQAARSRTEGSSSARSGALRAASPSAARAVAAARRSAGADALRSPSIQA
jgi:hypothetical protein